MRGNGCQPFSGSSLKGHEVDELVHRHRLERLLVEADFQDAPALLRREHARDVLLELLHEQRHALRAAASVGTHGPYTGNPSAAQPTRTIRL